MSLNENSKNQLLESYDQSFYNNQVNGSLASARVVVPLLLQVIGKIESVIDVGCGVGTWLSEFKRRGVSKIKGIDGGKPDEEHFLIDAREYHNEDITTGFKEREKCDLALSLEVAEHLEPRYAKKYVHNFCTLSDVLLFGAAAPGQGGKNHFNERWPSYWLDLFQQEGFQIFDVVRPLIWYDTRVEWWYRQNTFIFVKKSNSQRIKKLTEHATKVKFPYDIVHPQMFIEYRNMIDFLQQQDQNHIRIELEGVRNELEQIKNSRIWRSTSRIRKVGTKMKEISRRIRK
jgi:hypothetical protein